jgi:hypothetical protein
VACQEFGGGLQRNGAQAITIGWIWLVPQALMLILIAPAFAPLAQIERPSTYGGVHTISRPLLLS